MKIDHIEPPRVFRVGKDASIEMKDCARIALQANEQITFTTSNGSEYDVARKDWGYYATPSLNGRLPKHGLRPALCMNTSGQVYLLLVEPEAAQAFENYLTTEGMRVVLWFDDETALSRLVQDSNAGG